MKTIDEALRVSLPGVAESAAEKIVATSAVKTPEEVHEKVLTQA